METEKQFWKSKSFALSDKNLNVLIAKLNKFYENKFIVGTQTHFVDGIWYAISYYKVK